MFTLDGIDIHFTSKWTGSDIVKENYTYQTIFSTQMSKRLGKKYRKREMFEEMPRKCIEGEQKQ